MAHTCPRCGSYCTCRGDWDDCDFGININCECDCSEDDDEELDDIDDPNHPLNPPIKANP